MFPHGSLEFEEDDAFWSWLAVWMRFSQLRLLTWQRNYNTKPRELAASAEAVTFKIARAWAAFPRTSIRSLVRLMLCMMSRGGNKGQAIRDEILNIMHRHKIPEHGTANFYEQWHQKLHNNTTPDDIGICEGLLAFLRSGGNMDAYRGVLARHKITSQRLVSYERPIRNEPFVPHCDTARLIHDFEHYLDILKDVHESLDLQKSMERARPFLRISEGVVQKALRSLSSHRDRPTQVFFAITDARRALSYLLNDLVADTCAIRELLFLDFAFEQQQSFIIQALGNNNLPQSHGALHTEVAMLLGLLESMVFHRKDDSELRRIEKDWRHWAEMCIRWGDYRETFSSEREAALLLMALVDRLSRWVSNHVFQTTKLLQDKAEFLAVHVLPEGPKHPQVDIFVEEILRSSISFALSLMLKRVEPVARKAAELSSWQLISVGRREPVDARLVEVESLYDMQHVVYPEPTVLLSGSVSGEEDVPQGVVGVIVKHSSEAPDILSHVAVRARNSGVFLVVCYEPAFLDVISQVVGTCQRFSVDTGKGDLKWSPVSEECLQVTTPEADRVSESKRTAWRMWGDVDASVPWLIEPKDFTSALVGGKSLNLQTLKASLEELGVKTPTAFALPYGVFNKILNHRNNSEVRTRILASFERLQQASDFKSMECCLTQIADCLDHALPPPELSSALRNSVMPVIEDNGLFFDEKGLWSSVVGVYQSQFSLRPWLSLTKAGKDYSGLMMAVLVQDLVPATFAFVLHSQNPASTETEMFGELVSGLGETLVSNEPGQALSWTCKPDDAPKIRSFFSKSVSLQPGTLALIARSDSNSEDLDGFAGAGLFESLTVGEPRRRRTCYSAQGTPCHLLVTDLGFRQHLLSEVSRLAFKVQELMGTPVDVEGCVVLDVNEKKFVVHVVQARPQV
ncbi:MAG: hypothetical protein KVP17_003370 [Porospora cf. gigantea B]|nr:MAG: hypothetical protein KVP17_003370 [Porospora cf. gigantea B]